MGDLVRKAELLARRAHAGQLDKAGRPYIDHVARVAARVRGDEDAEAVAWLHDVMEDCEALAEEVFTFPHRIAYACTLLNRAAAGTSEAYYSGIRSNPLARKVKLADIADNADPARLKLLPEKTARRLRRKYADALARVTARGGD